MDSVKEEWEECGEVLIDFINSATPKKALYVLKRKGLDTFSRGRFYYDRYSSYFVKFTKKELKSLLLTPREHENYSNIVKNIIKPYKSLLSRADVQLRDIGVPSMFGHVVPLEYDYILAECLVTFFKKENAVDYVGQCLFCGNLFLAKRRNRRKYCDNKGKCRKADFWINRSLES